MSIDTNLINGFVTFLVGGIAFVVYWLKKKDEKRSAATIIIMDIRHAEQVVASIIDRGTIDISMKEILLENNWSKYKHLFAQDFSQDDFVAFNRFFYSCVEMSDARQRLRDVFYTTLNTKAQILQQKIYEIEDFDTSEGKQKAKKILGDINQDAPSFSPNEPKERMMHNLKIMGTLSNTVAFDKLYKITGSKA